MKNPSRQTWVGAKINRNSLREISCQLTNARHLRHQLWQPLSDRRQFRFLVLHDFRCALDDRLTLRLVEVNPMLVEHVEVAEGSVEAISALESVGAVRLHNMIDQLHRLFHHEVAVSAGQEVDGIVALMSLVQIQMLHEHGCFTRVEWTSRTHALEEGGEALFVREHFAASFGRFEVKRVKARVGEKRAEGGGSKRDWRGEGLNFDREFFIWKWS